jgi:hypothetical protein
LPEKTKAKTAETAALKINVNIDTIKEVVKFECVIIFLKEKLVKLET